jgi:hypothetical protein
MEWIGQNALRGEKGIESLTNKVSRLRDALERAQQQTIQSLSTTSAGDVSGQKWQGGVPYLRMIMCLTQDKCEESFSDPSKHADTARIRRL